MNKLLPIALAVATSVALIPCASAEFPALINLDTSTTLSSISSFTITDTDYSFATINHSQASLPAGLRDYPVSVNIDSIGEAIPEEASSFALLGGFAAFISIALRRR